jgi:hypothetical protein
MFDARRFTFGQIGIGSYTGELRREFLRVGVINADLLLVYETPAEIRGHAGDGIPEGRKTSAI